MFMEAYGGDIPAPFLAPLLAQAFRSFCEGPLSVRGVSFLSLRPFLPLAVGYRVDGFWLRASRTGIGESPI
jgi:hypothetical protein